MMLSIPQNKRLVMKFGGTSVKDVARIEAVADKIAMHAKGGDALCVVVSAMAGETNRLIGYCQAIHANHHNADYDAVLAAGEQVTAGLLALALEKRGLKARSWMGWQVPISCDNAHGKARIRDIPSQDFCAAIDGGEIAVVAGFQGISPDNRITTLGRGGSDTTAVALAAALKAQRCDIYTDVDGLYTADPRIEPQAQKIDQATFQEVLELASLGAKVLHPRAVELAMKENMPLSVLSSYTDGTGTIIVDEDERITMEESVVSGIAHLEHEAQITIHNVEDRPGIAADIIAPLAAANIVIDMIVQNASQKGLTDMTFSIPLDDCDKAEKALRDCGFEDMSVDSNVAKISAVGIGMRSHAGVAATFFDALKQANINIKVITTSDIKISVLIDRSQMVEAVRVLHDAYHLDQ